MKKLLLLLMSLISIASIAYTQAPVKLKTEWGAKVTPENAWRLYPRPQMTRANWTNLNGLWQYAVTKKAPACPKKWDGKILVPFVLESSLSGVGRILQASEQLWYRRDFDADVKPGERLLLHFEQVDFRTMVFVNGKEVGIPHEGGQMPFSYDITDYVKSGKNELVVSVWDPTNQRSIGSTGKQHVKPNVVFYLRSSGIGGTVWMEKVPTTYIAGFKVTPDIDKGTVDFEFDVQGAYSRPEVVVTTVGKTVKTSGGKVTVKMPKGYKLWSPESPVLYDFTAKCGEDKIGGYFGMRKVQVKKDVKGILRIFFNNEPRFLVGVLDQGWWPDGLLTPPSEEAMIYDIVKLKEMGFDMMRKHVKVEPRRYYYLCDKLGIILMQDMPSGLGDREMRYGFFRNELKQMIDHLYNVPSIVSWVPYNEGWGQPGQFLTSASLRWTRDYDPSRIVDGPSGWNDYEGGLAHKRRSAHNPLGQNESADLIDKHDYDRVPDMFEVNPHRASFLGEFGGIDCKIIGHLWTERPWGKGGTGRDTERKGFQNKFITLMDHIADLSMRGLCGSVYTQTTDVEGQINGLITYDRKIVKFEEKELAKVHDRVRKAAKLAATAHNSIVLAKCLDENEKAWAWTTEKPSKDWYKPQFDDSSWARSAGGFGNDLITKSYSRAKVRTVWDTKEIYLRRHFKFAKPEGRILQATINMFHDEDVEVYLNGKLILSEQDCNTNWRKFGIDTDDFMSAVREGDNVIAVKVVQEKGGQYIDLGLTLEVEK